MDTNSDFNKKEEEVEEENLKEIEEELGERDDKNKSPADDAEDNGTQAKEEDETKEVVIEEDKDKPEEELTEEQKSKRDDRTFYIMVASIIIIIILFFAISYYYNSHRKPQDNASQKVTYNNFDFLYYDNFWNFQWQRGNDLFDVALRFNPYDAEKVPVYVNRPFNNFSTNKVYLAFDPLGNNTAYMALAVGEMGLSMKKVFNITPEAACTQNKTQACRDRPIINCSNTNESVILLQEVNDTRVLVDDNCVIIQGSQMEMLKAVDRVLYEWYGIIKHKDAGNYSITI